MAGDAVARFLAAHRRITAGLQLQRARVIARDRDAPRLIAESHIDVIDLRGDCGVDLDYYVYELARLQELARAISKTFGSPEEVVSALAAFDQAIPALRRLRNPLTHPSDDARLDGVAWFGAVVRLHPPSEVEYLVDPRFEHHDAALKLSSALAAFLEAHDSPP